jgi:hypothetical protein
LRGEITVHEEETIMGLTTDMIDLTRYTTGEHLEDVVQLEGQLECVEEALERERREHAAEIRRMDRHLDGLLRSLEEYAGNCQELELRAEGWKAYAEYLEGLVRKPND